MTGRLDKVRFIVGRIHVVGTELRYPSGGGESVLFCGVVMRCFVNKFLVLVTGLQRCSFFCTARPPANLTEGPSGAAATGSRVGELGLVGYGHGEHGGRVPVTGSLGHARYSGAGAGPSVGCEG